MKGSLNPAILICVSFVVTLISCQKKSSENEAIETPNQLSKKLTLEDAQSFHRMVESKYGNYELIKISDKTKKNFKHIDFSHAYVGENETSFFVEAPISYTTRKIMFSANSSISTSTLKKMASYSLDRIVIYKDKVSGMISEKIITIIPSVDYLSKDHKDLRNSHYQSIVPEFSGYVSYKDWKGRFLSSQQYISGKKGSDKKLATKSVTGQANLAQKTAKVSDVSCSTEEIYTMYAWCEDVDADGHGVNCDWVIISFEADICYMIAPVFHNHQAPLPGPLDTYWQGFPDPQLVNSGNNCPPYGGRANESPIMYAAINATSVSVSFYDACFCQGYSWIILENMSTGTEYSIPISNQNFLITGCTSTWETNALIPTNIPNGDYFIKVNLDGDLFYHQFERDGSIIRRFKHTLLR